MDGVLADFDGQVNALDRYKLETGFFSQLQTLPLLEQVRAMLIDPQTRQKIYILSASPNEKTDHDKKIWLSKHLPLLYESHIIFVRNGADKAQYANGAILIDDYTPNLKKWEQAGGVAIKYLNGKNGKTKSWKGQAIYKKFGNEI